MSLLISYGGFDVLRFIISVVDNLRQGLRVRGKTVFYHFSFNFNILRSFGYSPLDNF